MSDYEKQEEIRIPLFSCLFVYVSGMQEVVNMYET